MDRSLAGSHDTFPGRGVDGAGTEIGCRPRPGHRHDIGRDNVEIDGTGLTLEAFWEVVDKGTACRLTEAAGQRVQQARRLIEEVASRGDDQDPVYGVNTGFGDLSKDFLCRRDLSRQALSLYDHFGLAYMRLGLS